MIVLEFSDLCRKVGHLRKFSGSVYQRSRGLAFELKRVLRNGGCLRERWLGVDYVQIISRDTRVRVAR